MPEEILGSQEVPERKGVLIVFEGIDGAGKTTQANLLFKNLEARNYDVLLTREPTDGPYGQKIRGLFVRRSGVTPEDELTWFTEDRKEHVAKVIRPKLEKGCVIITDRYYYSTMAYQGARGVPVNKIREMNEVFAPKPDLVILLVAKPDESVKRIRDCRLEGPNSFEKEDYLGRVQHIFLSLPDTNIVKIDGQGSVVSIQSEIQARVDALIATRSGLLKKATVS